MQKEFLMNDKTLYERVIKVIYDRNLSVLSVEKGAGLSVGQITKMKYNTPYADKVAKLAKYLCVSADYLLGIENEPQYIMPKDIALMYYYLDEWHKGEVNGFIKGMAKSKDHTD
jgi:hypothetical protein